MQDSPDEISLDDMTSSASSESEGQPSLVAGTTVIKSYLKTLPLKPGVYRMLDADQTVLYVGKAKALKNRVASYTRPNGLSTRIARMVAQTRSMVFIETHTEAEALLLEANLIKKLKPRFNVLLRDDKSFPYVLIRTDHPWAQLTKHRGKQKDNGHYYGPFASAGAVNQTLNTLQRVFLLRSCSDSVFNNRTRPCLLYQIKRCSGPCVDRIDPASYGQLIKDADAFLRGRETGIQKRLAADMQKASDNLEFERAAALRDRLQALTKVQQHQNINMRTVGDADVVALYQRDGQTCIQVFFYRAGRNWGNRAYFPRHDKSDTVEAILAAFLTQFYDNKPAPGSIIVSHMPEVLGLMEEAFTLKAGYKVKIHLPQRGEKKNLIDDALRNAEAALLRRQAETSSQLKNLRALSDIFDMESPPTRIEVYDNSHIQGQNATGAMIVAGPEGFQKNAYRKFNIKDTEAQPGDDFAMMREVFYRRFARAIKEDPDKKSGNWPDLVLIDGGRGQLNTVMAVVEELGVQDVTFVGISKGLDRDAGREQFHMPDRNTFMLKDGDPALYFLQRLRDEAHRFAIGTHRNKRSKDIQKSPLDDVPGIGGKRKKALLHHFGSAKEVANAGIEDLKAVEGISAAIAQTIYDYFH